MTQLAEILITYLTYSFFLLLAAVIHSDKKVTNFEVIAIFFLSIVSAYAVAKTYGTSMYLLPLLISAYFFWSNRSSIKIGKPDLALVTYGNVLWLIFLLIYYILGNFNFRLPHEDYITYSRIAFYNNLMGVENVKTVNNLFDILPNDVYHFTEVWGMSLLQWVNGQSLLKNYIFTLCPMMTLLILLGLRELQPRASYWILLAGTFAVLTVVVPFDAIKFLGYRDLPRVGGNGILFGPKLLSLAIVCLAIILYFKRGNQNRFRLSLFSFYYPLVIPVLLPSLIIISLSERGRRLLNIGSCSVVLLYFVVHNWLFGTPASGLINLWNFADYHLVAKAIIMSGLLPALFLAIPLWILLGQNVIHAPMLKLIGVALSIGVVLNISYADHMDAVQLVGNFSYAMLAIAVAVALMTLVLARLHGQLLGLIAFYVFPFALVYRAQTFIEKPQGQLADLFAQLPSNEIALVLPKKQNMTGEWFYNGNLVNPLSHFFLVKEDFHLVGVAVSFPLSTEITRAAVRKTLDAMRYASPLFRECGEWTGNFDCLFNFAQKRGIKYIFIETNLKPEWINNAILDLDNYFLYDLAVVRALE